MNILEKNYNVLDSKENISIPDSFVMRENKIGTGNGEKKLYVGQEGSDTWNFFGEKGFENNCFMLKKDLIQFLNDLEIEHKYPNQQYRHKKDMLSLYSSRLQTLNSLPDKLNFTIQHQNQIAPPRVYINSDNNEIYNLMREISLPWISNLHILKLERNNDIFYYYRLFTDFSEKEHPGYYDEPKESKYSFSSKSEGRGILQKQFKEKLIQLGLFCPFTNVKEPSLLIASHIKPWKVSNEYEKTDPNNGFLLSLTIDKLFDKGFITFTEDKFVLISPFFSTSEINKLNIFENKKYETIPINGRLNYLRYHQEHIFRN